MSQVTRRGFIKTASAGGVGMAAASVAAPAIAQSSPEIKWRLAASWPKSLDTLFGGCEYIDHLIEVDLADLRQQLVGVHLRQAVIGVNPADQFSERDA